ncbi:hypothetical protein M3Y96_00168400 [Aphelenchoides besseyi]|nr:hypothetical protein M3Y96_00168400 [Aphelenchoides besseyi]
MSKALLLITTTFSFVRTIVGVWCYCYMSGQCWTPGLNAWDTVQLWTGTTVPPEQKSYNHSSAINEKITQLLETRTNISL